MGSCQLEALIRQSKTASHLLQLHCVILKTALDADQNAVSGFISSACSISIDFAVRVLEKLRITPSSFAWNTIITAYAKSSRPIEAVRLFSKMQWIGPRPDNFTYPFVIKACRRCLMIGEGGALHSMVFKTGFGWERHVGNTLLRMYAAFGAMGVSRQVFDEMTNRDVVTWSSMIAGYVACNYPLDAFKMFRQMKLENVKPNSITLVSMLSSCTHLLDFRAGKSIHSYITVNCIELDVSLGTSLLEMYSKCGGIKEAFQVFSLINDKNLQCWTVMISALADHSLGQDAISLFTQMEKSGLKPDSMSFSGILSACSHLGLVEEGQKYFDKMVRVYGIKPTLEHYGCMVDLLGRAGLIDEASGIIKSMPMEPNTVILRTLLSACRNHGQVLHLDDTLTKLLELEPELGANYVLLSNVSSVSGCWNDAADLRISMKQKGLKKVQGSSSLEVNKLTEIIK